MNTWIRILPALFALAIAGCTADDEAPDEVATTPADQAPMPMGGMAGMQQAMGAMQSDSMIPQMQSRMSAMMRAAPDSMLAMRAGYRQTAANMLAQMNSEMRQMRMEGDSGWNATADSVRQDLTRMPELTAEEMAALMPAHQARMNRLMEMHQAMTRTMTR